MDMNLKRRTREREIAREIAGELVQNISTTAGASAPDIAMAFGRVFARIGIEPTEAEARRIAEYVRSDIAKRQRAATNLAADVARHRIDAERMVREAKMLTTFK